MPVNDHLSKNIPILALTDFNTPIMARYWLLILLLLFSYSFIPAQNRPNVILILTDDQGSIDMGAYGVKDLQTPHMDRIAKEGVRFTQFYAAAPVCSPSRAAILTGKVPQRAGVPGNVGLKGAHRGLDGEQVTLAEMFKDAGYQTAHIGKWHLGYDDPQTPNGQGFDYSFGHMVGCIDNYSHFYYWSGPNLHNLFRNGEEIFRDGEYFPDLLVQEASQFMEENKTNPFFIYFALNTPHYPYQGDVKWLRYYNEQGVPYPRNLYNAFVSSQDERIGALLDKVEELGLKENTIIVFQSDHGHSTEERAHFGGGNPGPFRGAKFSLFEGGLRVPAMISWPGNLPQNEVRPSMAVATDWLPTLAELCNAPLPESPLDGKSLVPMIQGKVETSPHSQFCWQNGHRWAVKKGSWKLLFDPRDTSTSHRPPPNKEVDKIFLVNLSNDPGEQYNLRGRYPEKVAELTQIYEEWAQQDDWNNGWEK